MNNGVTQKRSSLSPEQTDVRIGSSPLGRGFRLETALVLPRSRESLFEFFGDAFQLETITPPWLQFKVLTPAPVDVSAGTLIDYRLKLHGIPIRWQSRIKAWKPPFRFIDEQTRGPYRQWHHEHLFEEADDGTLCRDVVDYEVFGGRVIDALLVRRDLYTIFEYRQRKMIELFS